MKLHTRKPPRKSTSEPKVGHDERIRPGRKRSAGGCDGTRQARCIHKGVQGDVNARRGRARRGGGISFRLRRAATQRRGRAERTRVREGAKVRKLLKGEPWRGCAGIETRLGEARVDGVGPCGERRQRRVERARRSEQLRQAVDVISKVRALGLSNFPQEKIAEVIEHAEVKPQLVTVECHPYHAQKDLCAYLAPYGTVIEAWYPLGHGDKAMQEEPVFVKLGEKYGKAPAQVILRWHVQMGTSIIPGSKNPAHIADNAAIFDFELTEDEMAEIAKLDGAKIYYTATEEALAGYLNMKPDFDAQE